MLVFLDEADQKMVDDINSKEAADEAAEPSQEPATNICHDTVGKRVRLATVDNFQGRGQH